MRVTIHVPGRSKAIQALLAKARKNDVIVKATDGAEFLLTAIDDFDREIAATRRNKKLMAYLDTCASETELIPLAKVKRQLGLAKTGRKGPRATEKRTRK